jgi:ABC-type dipeptide/oligopeptide/nickel transport system ATPase component
VEPILEVQNLRREFQNMALVTNPITPPSFGETIEGCPFAPRCTAARAACGEPAALEKKQYDNGHWALCPFGCEE